MSSNDDASQGEGRTVRAVTGGRGYRSVCCSDPVPYLICAYTAWSQICTQICTQTWTAVKLAAASLSIPVADGEHVQQFKALWNCKRNFYAVPVQQ